MSRISHFKLGLFIVICGAILAVALIWIGATEIFKSNRTYVAFFGEPVTGLRAGASVDYLGVRIGSVDSVEIAPGERLVQVNVKLRSSFKVGPTMALSLAQAGLTGSPFLALAETPAPDRSELPHPSTKLPVLPTRPGGGGIGGAVAGIEKKLASLDIQGLLTAWEGVARQIDTMLTRGGVEQVIENARLASAGVRQLAGIGPQGQPSQLEVIVRDLQASTESLRIATASIAKQVESVRPGTVAMIASRVQRTTGLGEKAVRSVDQNVDASMLMLRENLAQLKQAVIEAQSLARSLRVEPSRVIERGGGSDPFNR